MTLKKIRKFIAIKSNQSYPSGAEEYISISSKWQIQGIHIFDFEIYAGATSTNAN